MKTTDRRNGVRQEGSKSELLSLEELLRLELHEMVIGAGMRVLGALLEDERSVACGPRYAHAPDRRAVRAGHAAGELVLGGRRVSVLRPRARTVGGREVALPSWRHFAAEDPLHERAVEQAVLGVSTRRYARSLEPLPEGVRVRGTSRSAVSRRFVAATAAQLDAFLERDLGDVDLAALMIDGVHFADHVVLVALGIDASGGKHVLGLREGATENATACTALLSSMAARGLRTHRAVLVVLDGSKALAGAVRKHWGRRALVQRCQAHKKRNVLDHLPERLHDSVGAAIREAYKSGDAERAERLLLNLARTLETEHPGAAASMREGLDETLTVMRLELPRSLERTLATTNAIENLVGSVRRVSRNVKRWRGGRMILRWMAAGVLESAKGFRKLRGCAGMPKLLAALRAHDAKIDGAVDQQKEAA